MAFCVHCGSAGAAAFCSDCGQAQASTEAVQRETHAEYGGPWHNSVQYAAIVRQPAVRTALEQAAASNRSNSSSAQWLALLDAVSPLGVSIGTLADAIVPLSDKLGIRTSRSAAAAFTAPAGKVLATALVAQVELNCPLLEVRQEQDRCSLIAEIPSNLFTWMGRLAILVDRREEDVLVQVSATIAGQWYDWGKSNQLIQLTLHKIRASLQATQPTAARLGMPVAGVR